MLWMQSPLLKRFMFALVLVALPFAGCSNEPNAPPTPPKTCPAGEWLLADGRCQPAGLPLDMQCPPGELALENGGCQPAGLPPDMVCPPGEWEMEGGGCAPAGLPPDMVCPPGETEKAGGGCEPAGIPPEMCGQGFVSDGNRGCNAILPVDTCPNGMMAVPGDTTCREVAPCGMGDWGDIPVGATTQFVNAAYPLNDSNGSPAKPWKTIQAAVTSAAPNAIVAIAAGTYTADVVIQGKAVKLWGRCPGMVEIKGTVNKPEAIAILGSAANASEVRGVSITGPKVGVTVFGSSKVVLDRIRIHDTGGVGIAAKNGLLTKGEVALADSLVERAAVAGVYAYGAKVTIERSLVRETKSNARGTRGLGIDAAPDGTSRADVSVGGSLVEKNHEIGILVTASDAWIESTVVRETLPNGGGDFGIGIYAKADPGTGERANVTVLASLVKKNHENGFVVSASDAQMEYTVVRETQPNGNGQMGEGVRVQGDSLTGQPAAIEVHASLIEKNDIIGVAVLSSDALIDATVVRETQNSGNLTRAGGIIAQEMPETGKRSNLTVRGSLVEKNHTVGTAVVGSDALIEATVVRENLPDGNGDFGRGLQLTDNPNTGQRAVVAVHASLIEDNYDVGALVSGADALFEGTVVRATQPGGTGSSGQGIKVENDPKTGERANVTIRASVVENNHKTGVDVINSDALVEAIVVRETQSYADESGTGISIARIADAGEGSNVTVRASVVENNHGMGIFVESSIALVEATVVRETQLEGDGDAGRGIVAQVGILDGQGSNLILRASLIEKNHGMGIYVRGSDALIEAILVRENLPDGNGKLGLGIDIESAGTGPRANVTVRGSLFDKNIEMGIYVAGSDAQIEDTVVRDTLLGMNGNFGRGIQAQFAGDLGGRANLRVSASLLDNNHEAGIYVVHSDATIESTLVRGTIPNVAEMYGDGIVVRADSDIVSKWGALPPIVAITATRIEYNERAGIGNFGGSIKLVSSVLICHKFDMDGEPEAGYNWSFEGSHDNLCGCPEPTGTCGVKSANPAPPTPIVDTPGPTPAP